ncbi:MAG: hypothetical protein EA417_15330 [Gammaproteobacteria bacterium]|nr:MAG: hypothetical protein EA417_15330 [Gammaproteobacteria bacterium]
MIHTTHPPLWSLSAIALLAALWLHGPQASAGDAEQLEDRLLRPDFGGHWEKDYGRSDHWEQALHRTVQQVHQQAQLQQRRGDSHPTAISSARRQTRAIISKARLAEMITRPDSVRIVQTGELIRIERPDDAPLICSTRETRQATFDNVHGSESCGWSRDQLVFDIQLAEGVSIQHRFDVEGETLSMLTRVSSRGSRSFDLRHFFTRYEPRSSGLECVQTLTQGQVCSTHSRRQR